MAERLYIDFETYSACDIEKHGGVAYALHPTTCMLCMGYAFDDAPAQLLKGIEPLPIEIIEHVTNGGKVYAHNMAFDFRIWNYVCTSQLGWPTLSLEQVVDTMALCLTFQVPASLKDAGAALQISMPKNPEGKRLINTCCKPDKNGLQPMPFGANKNAFDRLFAYCVRDVEAMRQIVKALPRELLIEKEQKLWELTYTMNSYGLPVDKQTIRAIEKYLATYIEQAMSQVPILTAGQVESINQVAKLKDWCIMNGYFLESLTADQIKIALADETCPPHVKEVLTLRQELGRSSVAKFIKLNNLAHKKECGNWYVFDNLQYHGAGTGRWAGRGFQVHNLPRASVPNPDEFIEAFRRGETIPDPVSVGKALIRPMICAPSGHSLLVSDYSSIENRILHYLAEDWETLEEFRLGMDQYKTMAAARYGVSYEDVSKPQRQMGKVIILGCGFQMGGPKFQDTAKVQFGMDIPLEEAKLAVRAYRDKYPLVEELWSGLKNACAKAVITGRRTQYKKIIFATAKIKGTVWLAMLLPSGKALYYMSPEVHQMFIPDYEHMGRVPTVTHMGLNPYSRKWSRLKLIPGRITENAVQGTARECMGQGLINVVENMPYVAPIASVHDEAISIINNNRITDSTIDLYNEYLCHIPWAQDLPLKAEGYISQRYKKG